MANILYRKQKQQKSLDNGITWIDTGEFRIGDIIEKPSNCSSSTSKQYRWIELDSSDGYWCASADKYTVEVEESSSNGIVWTRTGNQRKGSKLIESNSIDCGYLSVEYRWILDTSGMYWCDEETFTKYAYEIEESSTNGGEWRPTGNKRQSTTVMETDSEDCGYCTTVSIYSNHWNPTLSMNGVNYYPNKQGYIRFNINDFGVSELTDTSYMFNGDNRVLPSSSSISQIYLIPDTSNVTNMQGMFSGCHSLTNLDVLNSACFSTINTTNMSNMFYLCSGLTRLDVSSFDTSKAENMSGMFNLCCGIKSLDVSSFDTSNVTDVNKMFRGCSGLTELDLSNFNTSNVTDMSGMFSGCTKLESLDLSNFNTSNVTNMEDMFEKCTKLKTLNLSGWDFSNSTNSDMFNNTSLEYLDLSNANIKNLKFNRLNNNATNINLTNVNTTEITDMSGMFSGCTYITSLDVTYFDTSNVTDMSCMFSGCTRLESLDLSNFDTSNVISINNMFDNCNTIITLDLTKFNFSGGFTYLFRDCYNLKTVDVSTWDVNVNINSNNFSECRNLRKLIVMCGTEKYWENALRGANILNQVEIECIESPNKPEPDNPSGDTECTNELQFSFTTGTLKYRINGMEYTASGSPYSTSVNVNEFTNASKMFYDCSYLTDVSKLPCTDNVTNMSRMFDACTRLESINLNFINTSNVTNMSYMFENCRVLTEIDLSGFDTSKVTDMGYMFKYCSGLTTLDLRSFNTSNVTSMNSMFNYCSGLTELELSNFDTSNVTTMGYMFNGCSGLTSLDLSSFYTSNLTDVKYMFEGCKNLQFIDLSNFDVSNIIFYDYMFRGCNNLTELIVKCDTEDWWIARLEESNINHSIIDITCVESGDVVKEWIIDSDRYYCDGYDKYTLEVERKSVDGGEWVLTGKERKGSTLLESNSSDCGYSIEYKWEYGSGYRCENYNKYAYEIEKYSINGGEWIPTGNERLADLLEANSSDCGYSEVIEWVTVENDFYCDGYNKYTLEVERVSINGGEWEYTGNERKGSTLLESNSNSCGYSNENTLSFEFSGDTCKFKINDSVTYTATSSPYTTTLSELGHSTLTTCENMFSGSTITNLITLPKTDNVNNFSYMFYNCKTIQNFNFTELGITNSNNNDCEYMFKGCTNLNTVNLDSNIYSSFYMFADSSVNTVTSNQNSNKFNLSNYAFNGCSNLTSIDLSNYSEVVLTYTPKYIFNNCSKLKTINLGYVTWSGSLSTLTSSSNIFKNCTALEQVIVKKGSTTNWLTKLLSDDKIIIVD